RSRVERGRPDDLRGQDLARRLRPAAQGVRDRDPEDQAGKTEPPKNLMIKLGRSALAAALSLSLIALSPGLSCYEAAAETIRGRKADAGFAGRAFAKPQGVAEVSGRELDWSGVD